MGVDTNVIAGMPLATLVGGLFALVGTSMAVVAARQVAARRRFLRASAVAAGTVVALRPERDPRDDVPTFRPRVRFRIPAGRDVTFESALASGGDRWRVGDTVAVRYEIDRPESAECDSVVALWGATGLFGLLAAVFSGVGLALLTGLIQP